MSTNICYQEILDSYPEYITKEQMYQICHISKRTCLYLLESGIVPCFDSGKKTRRYKIKTADVVEYLCRRQLSPSLFQAPSGYYSGKDIPISHKKIHRMRSFYETLLSDHSDVMTTAEVAEFTGYSRTSVNSWCSKGTLKAFLIKQAFHIPKTYLLDFLTSSSFICISVKSIKHKWFNDQIRRL